MTVLPLSPFPSLMPDEYKNKVYDKKKAFSGIIKKKSGLTTQDIDDRHDKTFAFLFCT